MNTEAPAPSLADSAERHHQRRLSGFADRTSGDGQFTLAEFDGVPDEIAEHVPSARIQEASIDDLNEQLVEIEQVADVDPPVSQDTWEQANAETKLVFARARLKVLHAALAELAEDRDRRPPAPEQWYR